MISRSAVLLTSLSGLATLHIFINHSDDSGARRVNRPNSS
jgi:hypothetical protein